MSFLLLSKRPFPSMKMKFFNGYESTKILLRPKDVFFFEIKVAHWMMLNVDRPHLYRFSPKDFFFIKKVRTSAVGFFNAPLWISSIFFLFYVDDETFVIYLCIRRVLVDKLIPWHFFIAIFVNLNLLIWFCHLIFIILYYD